MKSFSLLRTNVGLTTNIKVIVDSKYKLSLESIDSDPGLSLDRFKNMSFTKENYYDELLQLFYKDLPSDIAFKIKYDNDNDSMSNDYADQYDEIYNCGARNIINNKAYSEEFEYFAPLYITKNGLPENFIIFRVDGPGIINLTRNNFISEIINKLKIVKVFNLKKETPIGEWLDKNFISNDFLPDSCLDIDFRELEFCRWNGIDYKNGGFAYKSLFIDDILNEEKEIFELDKFITDSYRSNEVVFPNILNLSFLFDDSPSTPDIKRKWSINRYYGFYIDKMEFFKSISPYKPSDIKSDVIVIDNLLISESSENPFVEDWNDNIPNYIEYNNIYYKVERYTEIIPNKLIKKSNNKISDNINILKKGRGGDVIIKKVGLTNTNSYIEDFGDINIYKYRIISDIDLSGITSDDINNNYAIIDNLNRIIINNNEPFNIKDFDSVDVWLIEIDGIYHNLVIDGDFIKVNTDYSFSFSKNDYTYKVSGLSKTVNTLLYDSLQPTKFSIFKINFSDIKDFDTSIVDTEYSKYEYEMKNDLTDTDETKMYLESIDSISNPPDLDDFNYKNKIVNIPVSSEYICNYELFKIEEIDQIKKLSDIWRKNPIYCRWVYQNSISGNDIPYLFNNSFIFEDFNRTTNIFDPSPNRIERNLDYFYTYFRLSNDTQIGSDIYEHQSLHVQEDFNFKKYLGTYTYSVNNEIITYNLDYFSYFFSKSNSFLNGDLIKNINKFSLFNIGDSTIPNSSLFRGIKFEIYEVTDVSIDSNLNINRINLKSSNKFNEYKLSILLSGSDEIQNYSNNILTSIENLPSILEWDIIDVWNSEKIYNQGDIVIYNDILYIANINNILGRPAVNVTTDLGLVSKKSKPEIGDWSYFDNNLFWIPNKLYRLNEIPFVYNSNEYYYLFDINGVDFWNPNIEYRIGQVVMFKNKGYISNIDLNTFMPGEVDNKTFIEYWTLYKINSGMWKNIQIWNPSLYYLTTETPYIIKDNILYKPIENIDRISINEEPGLSKFWKKVYSLIPNTDIYYSSTNNPIIFMNNRYYNCKTIANDSFTLDNGIIIYIDERYKNILVNINISDNTLPEVNNDALNRDIMYDNLYSKLTAANFIKAINDLSNKYEFTDYVKYVVIDESGKVRRYDRSNIINLPYLIRCEEPDLLNVKLNSLIKRPYNAPIKSNMRLDNGKIVNINQLNYFNNISIAAFIDENKDSIPIYESLHGNSNVTKSILYRYSGYYMPLFYEIQLFNKDNEFVNGNYKFNTDLTNFGIVKERIIRKINSKGSVLKLDNFPDETSIFPMLDEFGYTTYDFFIFSSTWDIKYFMESNINKNDLNTSINNIDDLIKIKEIIIPKDIGIN